ncbi:hypothetical protein [Streptomyces sp. JV178]|uniref:hypothetical protein n=1 Tax=Streptomyces sp. JV178 TaxID=858632 RepID=UPI00117F1C94|nr:hypothetical protein [Streptomyces sp. JV178]
MTRGGESVGEPAAVSLTKQSAKTGHRLPVWAVAGAVLLAAAGVGLWSWAPWVDRTPFTAYTVGVQDAQYTVPGSNPGTCVRTAASEEETVVFDEDGRKLAAGRAEEEGEVLGPEFGDFAGDCLIITRIDGVPGGLGTYLTSWGGGDRSEITEDELRLPATTQRDRFKTMKKSEG